MTGFLSILTLITTLSTTTVSAFTPNAHTSSRVVGSRQSTADVSVQESFGFDFAEDAMGDLNSNVAGEANYKQWVGTIQDNSFLNRQYNLLRRVRELDLLTKTADAQILSRLEANGITLATLEAALPLADKLGLASVAGNNQQLLINFVAPLLVEPAPYLLPAIGSALEVGPAAFFGAAAAVGGLEVFFLVQDVRIPFVGLEAGIYVGALLVPVTALLFGLGAGLTITNSNKNA
mmetsp:Transcript_17937/g.21434  ORF Transcript_17937/g.21434 Transcript_17937/m.21434 type:complete len:234 (+) Transcript_17937:92-793(+)|eukprot:CAMPEP_0198251284 /NCGR_PEP_ID=MMETSP1447-20131203/2159_1 /TAXON_ID=420782 /ORGANISM="Chaetoceros dichaeta, Strain CCMP1751" /LENGTH=233 /DNA_ID=CAMNT_0043936263 /DNA_START=118 /DNA_END=819 /DNA_ORIENTATION=-